MGQALTGLPFRGSGTVDDMTSSPFDDANEADVAEQQRSTTDGDEQPTSPDVSRDEANEADVLEQVQEVPEDDEDHQRG